VELTRAFVELHTGAVELTRAVVELHTGAVELTREVVELHTVAVELTRAVVELHTGAVELTRAVVELHTGAVELTRAVVELLLAQEHTFFLSVCRVCECDGEKGNIGSCCPYNCHVQGKRVKCEVYKTQCLVIGLRYLAKLSRI
jgi:hypothetical protein